MKKLFKSLKKVNKLIAECETAINEIKKWHPDMCAPNEQKGALIFQERRLNEFLMLKCSILSRINEQSQEEHIAILKILNPKMLKLIKYTKDFVPAKRLFYRSTLSKLTYNNTEFIICNN